LVFALPQLEERLTLGLHATFRDRSLLNKCWLKT